MPGANPTGAGGIEVGLLGQGFLVIVQAFQVFDWFDRDKWGVWMILVLSIVVCLLLWRDDLQKGVVNAAGAAWQGFSAFGPLSKLGVLSGQTMPAGQSPA